MKNKYILMMTLSILFICLFPLCSFADNMGEKEEGSLTIVYQHDQEPLAEASFDVFYVGDISDDQILPVQSFSKYPIDWDLANAEDLRETANALKGYVIKDKLEPTAVGRTNQEGVLLFGSLSRGVYLIVGSRHVQNDYVYESEPFFVTLPTFIEDEAQWSYDVKAEPKKEATLLPPTPEKITRKVLKVWDDGGEKSRRPESITVDLLRDGEVYQTVELNEDCQWSHTWKNLSEEYEWMVVESAVEGYKVKTSLEGKTFVITNTGKTYPPADTPEPEEDDTLPVTGQPWVICVILFAAGLFFVVLGLVCRRGAGDEA